MRGFFAALMSLVATATPVRADMLGDMIKCTAIFRQLNESDAELFGKAFSDAVMTMRQMAMEAQEQNLTNRFWSVLDEIEAEGLTINEKIARYDGPCLALMANYRKARRETEISKEPGRASPKFAKAPTSTPVSVSIVETWGAIHLLFRCSAYFATMIDDEKGTLRVAGDRLNLAAVDLINSLGLSKEVAKRDVALIFSDMASQKERLGALAFADRYNRPCREAVAHIEATAK